MDIYPSVCIVPTKLTRLYIPIRLYIPFAGSQNPLVTYQWYTYAVYIFICTYVYQYTGTPAYRYIGRPAQVAHVPRLIQMKEEEDEREGEEEEEDEEEEEEDEEEKEEGWLASAYVCRELVYRYVGIYIGICA